MRHISHTKKSRKIGTKEAVETTFYIFTEGKKTEPKYFEGMRALIGQNAAYWDKVRSQWNTLPCGLVESVH